LPDLSKTLTAELTFTPKFAQPGIMSQSRPTINDYAPKVQRLGAGNLSDVVVLSHVIIATLTGAEAISTIDWLVALGLEGNSGGRTTLSTGNLGSTAGIIAIALHSHQNATVGTALRLID
jgi:hypothetical protein